MRSMLRTGVLCCAVAGASALAVGCNLFSSDNKTTTAKKDEAIKAMQGEVEKLDKKIAELKDKADKAVGEEKAKLETKQKDIVAKREAFTKKYDQLKAVTLEKWEEAKKDTDAAFDALKKAVE